MVNRYSDEELKLLRQSGRILAEALAESAAAVRPGISTFELDALAEQYIRSKGGVPAFLGYHERGMRPYPASLCTSVNDELVHCIPAKSRKLRAGDIVSLDLGVNFKGLITDMAVTVPVGSVTPAAQKLMSVTEESLRRAISVIGPDATIGDIGEAVQTYAEAQNLHVIRDLVGHGVGKTVHEDPKIPNYGKAGTGMRLAAGMVIAIEPMLSIGTWRIRMLPDGWGIASADGSLTAHFEKTVSVTKTGCEILTE